NPLQPDGNARAITVNQRLTAQELTGRNILISLETWARSRPGDLERARRIERPTLTLARLCSTPELRPQSKWTGVMAFSPQRFKQQFPPVSVAPGAAIFQQSAPV